MNFIFKIFNLLGIATIIWAIYCALTTPTPMVILNSIFVSIFGMILAVEHPALFKWKDLISVIISLAFTLISQKIIIWYFPNFEELFTMEVLDSV